MAHFSNNTELTAYRAKWCSTCIHDELNDATCPVIALHVDFCGELHNHWLGYLIPQGKVEAGQCRMYVKKES